MAKRKNAGSIEEIVSWLDEHMSSVALAAADDGDGGGAEGSFRCLQEQFPKASRSDIATAMLQRIDALNESAAQHLQRLEARAYAEADVFTRIGELGKRFGATHDTTVGEFMEQALAAGDPEAIRVMALLEGLHGLQDGPREGSVN